MFRYVVLLVVSMYVSTVWFSTTFAQQDLSRQSDGKNPTERVVEETLIDSRAVLQRLNSNLGSKGYYTNIELPVLQGGKKYRVNITIVNPFSEPVEFSSITMSCGCGKFTGNATVIPALGDARFELQLAVPTTLQRAAAQSVFFHSLDDPSNVALTLRYTYEVSNVFGFFQRRMDLEIPESEKKVHVKIPFHVIEPITIDQLKLDCSESLNGVSFEIVESGGNSEHPSVLVETTPDSLPRSGVVGELTLRHVDTGVKSPIEIRISHQEPMTLRPESLRLTWDRETDSYQATSMLRIPSLRVAKEKTPAETDELAERGRAAAVSTPQVELAIGGEKATVSLIPLGNSGIFRISIRCDKRFDERPPETIDICWKIECNGVERIIDSHAFLPVR